ncbi:hypothetical protein BDN72DRAFT_905949 [Pluteus cervinus]|uniref:Uncharacterized protein n=1 Tax=Pluteus cervinus TaxID=181527 RepID=A0ACD3A1A2_9AGAR|nr:hypothetical protein BDN72DRAFT_905949 [Pluteus cervinus]
MDTVYNIQGAKHDLEEEQRWVDDEKEYLHAIVNLPSWDTTYGPTYSAEPSSWRLVKKTGAEKEEVVFTIQGVIEGKELPPVFEDLKIARNKAFFLHQSLMLSGLGTTTFEESLSALTKIWTVFGRQFPEGRLMPWQAGVSAFGGAGTLTLSNRYFTKKSEAGQMQGVPFPSNVDPKKILTKMLNPSLIHTAENNVQYVIRHSDLGRNFQYTPADPQHFRIGDIVEVQFSVVVYKMRTDYYVFKPMLYSIALLDAKWGNDLALCRASITPSPAPTQPLKRKIGYAVVTNATVCAQQGEPMDGIAEQGGGVEGEAERKRAKTAEDESKVSGGLAQMRLA